MTKWKDSVTKYVQGQHNIVLKIPCVLVLICRFGAVEAGEVLSASYLEDVWTFR